MSQTGNKTGAAFVYQTVLKLFYLCTLMRLTRYFLLFLTVTLVSCGGFEKLRKNGTDEMKYQAALDFYKKGDYSKAVIFFEELKPILKGSDQQEMATFYEAYCNYHLSLYPVASMQFRRFYDTFARSEYAEEALYMSAYASYKDSPSYNLDQGSTLEAIESLQSFINSYPQSKFVDEASKIIIELRDKLERKAYERVTLYYKTTPSNIANYRSAVIAATNFQRDFPDSKYNEELAFLKVKAEYELAQNSIEAKKKERYGEVIAFYQSLVDKYPENKNIRAAEKMYADSQKQLERIAEAEKAAKEARANATPAPAAAGKVGGGQ
jgi:outer membrane protein assembly factor BamD